MSQTNTSEPHSGRENQQASHKIDCILRSVLAREHCPIISNTNVLVLLYIGPTLFEIRDLPNLCVCVCLKLRCTVKSLKLNL